MLLEDKQQFKFGGVMSEQYTHSYIALSILNCCNLLKFYVFLTSFLSVQMS